MYMNRMEATISRINSVSDLNPLFEEWDGLAFSCPGRHFNQTSIYAKVAIERALRQKRAVNLILVRRSGRLVGVWPLVIRREGVMRVARPISCGSNEEYTEPLVDPSAQTIVLEAIFSKVLDLPCDSLWLMNIGSGTAIARLLERGPWASLPRKTHRISGYAMNLSRFSSWEDYSRQSPSRTASMRRKMQRLERLGDVSIGWCKTPEEAAEIIHWMFEAKRAWLKTRKLYTPWVMSDDVLQFFVDLSRSTDLRDIPMFTYIKLDGKVIAAQINFVGGDSLESFFIARSLLYEKCSVGELLTEYCIKLAIEAKLDFDLRIMTDRYKEFRCDIKNSFVSYQIYKSNLGKFFGPSQSKIVRLYPRIVQSWMRIRPPLPQARKTLSSSAAR